MASLHLRMPFTSGAEAYPAISKLDRGKLHGQSSGDLSLCSAELDAH